MATIDVSKFGGNATAAMKKLKRQLERQGGSGPKNGSNRHVTKSEDRRRAKLAAKKREVKKRINNVKNLSLTTRRYAKLSVQQIMHRIYGKTDNR